MSWEISHTENAWENVRERLSLKKWIVPMRNALVLDDVAKWRDNADDERSEAQVIKQGNAIYRRCNHEQLVNETMARIEDHRTCSNGGHKFYLDRQGWYSVSCEELPEHIRNKLPHWTT
jgi:hypothetical protein